MLWAREGSILSCGELVLSLRGGNHIVYARFRLSTTPGVCRRLCPFPKGKAPRLKAEIKGLVKVLPPPESNFPASFSGGSRQKGSGSL